MNSGFAGFIIKNELFISISLLLIPQPNRGLKFFNLFSYNRLY